MVRLDEKRAVYEKVAQATAWDPDLIAQLKHLAAVELLKLLDGPYTDEAVSSAGIWDKVLTDAEALEASGVPGAEAVEIIRRGLDQAAVPPPLGPVQ